MLDPKLRALEDAKGLVIGIADDRWIACAALAHDRASRKLGSL